MTLYPYPVTALSRTVVPDGATGRTVITGAVVQLFDADNNPVTMYDNAAGANGSTTKQTDVNGQAVIFVEAGAYRLEINGRPQQIVVGDAALRNELAAPDSSVLVGGAAAGNIGAQVNRYLRTPEDFGGSGNGSTNNDAALNAAVAAVNELNLPDKFRYNSTSAFVNPLGTPLTGNGHVVRTVTGGLEAQNTYADKHQRVTGLEYLSTWLRNIVDQFNTPNRALRIVFSGDSTTDGGIGNGVNPGFNINELVKQGLFTRGLQGAFGVICINRGQSGANTQQWVDNFLSGDIAAAGDLYVLRWGINDPGYLKDGSTPPLDAGQSYPNRRDVNDFATSLRAGLATLRAAKPLSESSILLMMPNSVYDIPNGRDALWFEQLRDVYVQAARDFKCAFIDTYAIMQDSKHLANVLMDNPFGDGRGIHPNDTMNSIIAGYICNLIAPDGLRYKYANNSVLNLGGSEATPAAASPPAEYGAALYHSRATLAGGWQIDGAATTWRTADNIVLQWHYGYKDADRGKLKVRWGRTATIEGQAPLFGGFWDVATQPPAAELGNLVASSGFTQFAARPLALSVVGSQRLIEGALTMNTPGTLSLNTELAQYSGIYGSNSDAAFGTATVFSGSAFEVIGVYLDVNGIIRVSTPSTLIAQRIIVSINYIAR